MKSITYNKLSVIWASMFISFAILVVYNEFTKMSYQIPKFQMISGKVFLNYNGSIYVNYNDYKIYDSNATAFSLNGTTNESVSRPQAFLGHLNLPLLSKSRVKRVQNSINEELEAQKAANPDGIIYPDGTEKNRTEDTLLLDCFRCLSNANADQEPVCDTELWNSYDLEAKDTLVRKCPPGTEFCVKLVHQRYRERTTERGCMGRGKVPGPRNTPIATEEGCKTFDNPPNKTTVCFCKHSKCNKGTKIVLFSIGFIFIPIFL